MVGGHLLDICLASDEVGEVVPPLMVQVDDDVHLFFNHLLDHSAVRACVAFNRLK